jgi:hypothetical protein
MRRKETPPISAGGRYIALVADGEVQLYGKTGWGGFGFCRPDSFTGSLTIPRARRAMTFVTRGTVNCPVRALVRSGWASGCEIRSKNTRNYSATAITGAVLAICA